MAGDLTLDGLGLSEENLNIMRS